MKKYKVHFSIFNLFSDSQKEVVKIQTYVKGLTAIVAGTTWYESNASYAMIVAIGGAVVDALLACFYFEEIK